MSRRGACCLFGRAQGDDPSSAGRPSSVPATPGAQPRLLRPGTKVPSEGLWAAAAAHFSGAPHGRALLHDMPVPRRRRRRQGIQAVDRGEGRVQVRARLAWRLLGKDHALLMLSAVGMTSVGPPPAEPAPEALGLRLPLVELRPPSGLRKPAPRGGSSGLSSSSRLSPPPGGGPPGPLGCGCRPCCWERATPCSCGFEVRCPSVA